MPSFKAGRIDKTQKAAHVNTNKGGKDKHYNYLKEDIAVIDEEYDPLSDDILNDEILKI